MPQMSKLVVEAQRKGTRLLDKRRFHVSEHATQAFQRPRPAFCLESHSLGHLGRAHACWAQCLSRMRTRLRFGMHNELQMNAVVQHDATHGHMVCLAQQCWMRLAVGGDLVPHQGASDYPVALPVPPLSV